MRVSNMPGSINHKCTRYGKYPPAIGISLLKIDVRALQYVFCGIIHFEGKTELFGYLPALIDQDRKYRAGGSGIVREYRDGLRRHRYQGCVGFGQQRLNSKQPAEVDIAVSAPSAAVKDHNHRRVLVLGKMLGQTPCSALSHRHRKVRCFVANADKFGSHAQSLDGRVYLASKQDVRLLDTSPCDQIFGEQGKGSCERDG